MVPILVWPSNYLKSVGTVSESLFYMLMSIEIKNLIGFTDAKIEHACLALYIEYENFNGFLFVLVVAAHHIHSQCVLLNMLKLEYTA